MRLELPVESERSTAGEDVDKIKNIVKEVVSEAKMYMCCRDREIDVGKKELSVINTNECNIYRDYDWLNRIKTTMIGTSYTNVVNLTSSKLSRPTLSLLSKGSPFIPSFDSMSPHREVGI